MSSSAFGIGAPRASATEKKRDRALYARLVESYQADRVGIFVDFDRLNHPKSPVWNPWENIGPRWSCSMSCCQG